jgi:hypothetical protein
MTFRCLKRRCYRKGIRSGSWNRWGLLPVELGAVPETPVLVLLFEGDPSMMVLNEFPVVAGFATFAPGF